MDFYKLSVDDVLSRLKTSRLGLGDDEALRRHGKFGLNELETKSKVNPFVIFSVSLKNAASITFYLPCFSQSSSVNRSI